MVLVVQGFNLARSEAVFRASGRPWPGSGQVRAAVGPDDLPRLRRERDAIARALTYRPSWSEGYQELGLVLIELYQASTEQGLLALENDPGPRALASTANRLHALIHLPAELCIP